MTQKKGTAGQSQKCPKSNLKVPPHGRNRHKNRHKNRKLVASKCDTSAIFMPIPSGPNQGIAEVLQRNRKLVAF